jgi:hypothetical protein
MKRNFLNEFKEICEAISEVVPDNEQIVNDDTRYNVHKRSIPPSIDRVVVMGLTKEQTGSEIARLIAKEKKRRENDDSGIFFYYDVVRMEAGEQERSIYFNDCPVML